MSDLEELIDRLRALVEEPSEASEDEAWCIFNLSCTRAHYMY